MLPPALAVFHAHSVAGRPETEWQLLPDHLNAVGAMAAEFASAFGCAEAARAAGLLHDLGKYTADYQNYIRGQRLHVDHSTRGAVVAIDRYPGIGRLLAYAIAGHHAGLADGQASIDNRRTSLADRVRARIPDVHADWEREIALPAALAGPSAFRPRKTLGTFSLTFLVRMLFSCLVDADYLDTEAFYRRSEGLPPARRGPHADSELPQLRAALDGFLHVKQSEAGDRPINAIRSRILAHVRAQAPLAPGLYSLTVPTGGGKTLASMAFALDHAIAHGLRRVIHVIPFTSVVEQSARVFRDTFGPLGDSAVLEHHSAFVDDPNQRLEGREKLHLAMENWDAPVIVTTAVQFFESLFGDRPAQCRKLHRIAGSVIVLDEAQTLPLDLLRPTLAALDELARHYGCTIVFCTATQPALSDPRFDDLIDLPRELAPDPEDLFRQLARVQVRDAGPMDEKAVVEQMTSRPQALCIVNNRRHAQALFDALAGACVDTGSVFHLSTLMCAAHRTQVLSRIRERLQAGQPCHVVSTSLIEAGVDISFRAVLRARAGMDSIAQAAGRCNREGLWPAADSEVIVFDPVDERWKPPRELDQHAKVAAGTMRQFTQDPLSPDAIRHYFRDLYWARGTNQLDRKILEMLAASKVDSLPFETLARSYRLIEDSQQPVIIPYDHRARAAIASLEHAQGATGLARELQRYVVLVPKRSHDALRQAGAIVAVKPEQWGDQFMLLANESLYGVETGLRSDDPTFIEDSAKVW